MLPERLTTDLTSLARPRTGSRSWSRWSWTTSGAPASRASTAPWCATTPSSPTRAWARGWRARARCRRRSARSRGWPSNLRLQDRVAQRLKARRHEHGALELETIEVRAVFDGDAVSGLAAEKPNRAKELIEDFMIAANGVIARFLEAHGFPGPAPRRALARALAAHRRDRRRARRAAARRARREGAERVPAAAPRGGPAALPRPLAVGHQAAGPGRVRGELPGRGRRPATSASP